MGVNASKESLIRAIWAIALPAIITNLTTPLLGLSDVAIAGHKGGAPFIASLAVGSSMFNMLYWVFGFLRMGSSGLTAQAYGSKDTVAIATILQRALTLGVGVGVIFILFQRPVMHLLFLAMDITGDTAIEAGHYFSIVIWGAPAMLATYSLTGWYLGMQNSRIPMMVSLLADVVNIVASVTLVFVFDMSIEGVATGTLVAQWIAFVVGLTICIRRYRPPLAGFREVFRGSGMRAFFRVNTDIFLRTLCLVAVTMWFTRTGARQSQEMLAVNALLMQMFTIFSFFMDGFAFSAEALVGRYKGEGNHAMLRRVVRDELLIALMLAMIFTAAYYFGGTTLLHLLTSDDGVVALSREYLPWAVSIPLVGFLAFCCDGIYIGATATRSMLLSMLAAMATFFGLYALLFPHYGNHGLWIAFLGYLVMRGALLLVMLNGRVLSERA